MRHRLVGLLAVGLFALLVGTASAHEDPKGTGKTDHKPCCTPGAPGACCPKDAKPGDCCQGKDCCKIKDCCEEAVDHAAQPCCTPGTPGACCPKDAKGDCCQGKDCCKTKGDHCCHATAEKQPATGKPAPVPAPAPAPATPAPSAPKAPQG